MHTCQGVSPLKDHRCLYLLEGFHLSQQQVVLLFSVVIHFISSFWNIANNKAILEEWHFKACVSLLFVSLEFIFFKFVHCWTQIPIFQCSANEYSDEWHPCCHGKEMSLEVSITAFYLWLPGQRLLHKGKTQARLGAMGLQRMKHDCHLGTGQTGSCTAHFMLSQICFESNGFLSWLDLPTQRPHLLVCVLQAAKKDDDL